MSSVFVFVFILFFFFYGNTFHHFAIKTFTRLMKACALFFPFFYFLEEVISGKKREKRKQMESEKIYFPKKLSRKTLSESQIFDIQTCSLSGLLVVGPISPYTPALTWTLSPC